MLHTFTHSSRTPPTLNTDAGECRIKYATAKHAYTRVRLSTMTSPFIQDMMNPDMTYIHKKRTLPRNIVCLLQETASSGHTVLYRKYMVLLTPSFTGLKPNGKC